MERLAKAKLRQEIAGQDPNPQSQEEMKDVNVPASLAPPAFQRFAPVAGPPVGSEEVPWPAQDSRRVLEGPSESEPLDDPAPAQAVQAEQPVMEVDLVNGPISPLISS